VKQLEQSLQEVKQSGSQHADTGSANARLAHENRVRGDLLCVLGIDKATQDRFIRVAPPLNPLFSQGATEAVGDVRRGSTTKGLLPQATDITLSPCSASSLIHNAHRGAHSPSSPDTLRPSSNSQTLLESLNVHLLPPETMLCPTHSSTSTPTTVDQYSSDCSTACSIAFSMILSNNKRGYKLIDLESRMRAGYQNATIPGEECRVLNKVLFEVLAEIA
jgi:hypothetical protein